MTPAPPCRAGFLRLRVKQARKKERQKTKPLCLLSHCDQSVRYPGEGVLILTMSNTRSHLSLFTSQFATAFSGFLDSHALTPQFTR